MLDKVKSLVDEYRMFQPEDKILLAVSGGPDSIVLAHVLKNWPPEWRLSLGIFHLNHMFRGEDAAADALFVQELAGQWQIPCWTEQYDMPAYLRKHHESPEAAARKIRYRLLEQYAAEKGFNKIALAHQADDQAETVLLNLLRGAGSSGLAGIPPVRGPFIRPLLKVSRQEIMTYLELHHLAWVTDQSNLQAVYRRNKIRLELLPYLREHYNPALDKALLQTAEIMRAEDAYLDDVSRQKAEQLIVCRSGNRLQEPPWVVALTSRDVPAAGETKVFHPEQPAVGLPIGQLTELPAAVSRRVLRLAWEQLTGSERDLDFFQAELIFKALGSRQKEGIITICPGNIAVRQQNGWLVWQKVARSGQISKKKMTFFYELSIPGHTYISEIQQLLTTELVKDLPAGEIGCHEAFLNYDPEQGVLYVRNRRPGDFFYPLGAAGGKKLKEFLIDQKVPHTMRDQVPLVCQGTKILWVGGQRIADFSKVTEDSKQIVHLQLRGSAEEDKILIE